MNYYEILGVSRTATAKEIKRAYRELARKWHPDLNRENPKLAEEKMTEINVAYTTLSDEVARVDYNKKLDAVKYGRTAGQKRRGTTRKQSTPTSTKFDFTNVRSNFEGFFGFDPKNKKVTNEEKLNTYASTRRKKNPLDAADMFEKFMGKKKMTRYNIYTGLIGILGVLFALTAALENFTLTVKIIFVTIGIIIFLDAARILYTGSQKEVRKEVRKIARVANKARTVTQVELLNDQDEIVRVWELYGRTSAIIGKDVGENFVDIDLSQSPYVALVSVQHAIINYANGNWYVEDLESENGISVQKNGSIEKLKVNGTEPCLLSFGDIIVIGKCRLRLN